MRKNYYTELLADFSIPRAVSDEMKNKLIDMALQFILMKEDVLPNIDATYTAKQIEQENKEWWPTHCQALREARGDILTDEYRSDLVYFCQDGPYYGIEQQKKREKHWWALIAQPGVSMTWPIVMFHGEIVYFEWACIDDETNEIIAKGSACISRRGHRGAWHFKSEQLTFYRDVFASEKLLGLLE